MVRFKEGDCVLAVKSGYGPGAGKLVKGTVVVGSFGPKNYIRVRWDGKGGEDAGFAKFFKKLCKMPHQPRRKRR